MRIIDSISTSWRRGNLTYKGRVAQWLVVTLGVAALATAVFIALAYHQQDPHAFTVELLDNEKFQMASAIVSGLAISILIWRLCSLLAYHEKNDQAIQHFKKAAAEQVGKTADIYDMDDGEGPTVILFGNEPDISVHGTNPSSLESSASCLPVSRSNLSNQPKMEVVTEELRESDELP